MSDQRGMPMQSTSSRHRVCAPYGSAHAPTRLAHAFDGHSKLRVPATTVEQCTCSLPYVASSSSSGVSELLDFPARKVHRVSALFYLGHCPNSPVAWGINMPRFLHYFARCGRFSIDAQWLPSHFKRPVVAWLPSRKT